MKRNGAIDLLRFIGIITIILYHANPSPIINQLINFAAPLLIVVSGLTVNSYFDPNKTTLKKYIKKRFNKLVIPTWLFLVLFFYVIYLIEINFNTHNINIEYNLTYFANTFLLFNNLKFIWIIKIYVILAFITYYAKSFKNSHSTRTYFSVLIIAYMLYELLLYFLEPIKINYEDLYNILTVNLFIPIIYIILFFYGLKLQELSKKAIIKTTIISTIIFTFILIYLKIQTGEFVQTYHYKFPPQLYYLAYAFISINVLYLLANNKKIHQYVNNIPIVRFISINSLWIYLWHMLAFYIWELFFELPELNSTKTFIMTTYMLLFSISATYIQLHMLKNIKINVFFKKKVA